MFLALQAVMERRFNQQDALLEDLGGKTGQLEHSLGSKIDQLGGKIDQVQQRLQELSMQVKTVTSLAVVAISVVGLCLKYLPG